MTAISSWLLSANEALNEPGLLPIWEGEKLNYRFKVYAAADSCWVVVCWPAGNRIAFRLAYAPGEQLEAKVECNDNRILVKIECQIGKYESCINLSGDERSVLRYQTSLTPSAPLLFPYWPRDIVQLGSSGSKLANGHVHLQQVGTRSGQLYFSLTQPKPGSVLYLQNLTALAAYNQDTETSAGDTVGGDWPEIGFALPPTLKNKSLEKGKPYVISDAVVVFDEVVPDNEQSLTRQYLDLLSTAYLALPKPDTSYKHWPDVLDSGIKDLIHSPGCWSQVDGNHYFNAYVSDYATPPEIMVQLAVLLPLLDYTEWSDSELEVMKKIKEGLPAFFDERYGTIMRWHPKAADKLEGEEEQKEPLTMDSWYLHHPLLNLSRLALKGDKIAEKLFLDSLGFAIKVAKHFDYQWPVFYKMDTLEVIKAETQPGKGGEKDVPGLYAHVMLQAWELTGEKKYLHEAEKSAQKLQVLGFDVFYQANNTAFSAGAMLRLFKATGKEL